MTKKLWYEDWEVITQIDSLSGLTFKTFTLPNAAAQQKITVGYTRLDKSVKDLTLALESALSELGKRKGSKK